MFVGTKYTFVDPPKPVSEEGYGPFLLRPSIELNLRAGVVINLSYTGGIVGDFANYPVAMHPSAGDAGFSQKGLFDAYSRRVKFFNLVLFCIAVMSHRSRKQHGVRPLNVAPEDLLHVHSSGIGLSGPGLFKFAQTVQGYSTLLENSYGFIAVIPEPTVRQAGDLVDQILMHSYKKTTELAGLIARALVATYDHDFSLAVATGWTVCEVLQTKLWSRYVDDQAAMHGINISASRRRVLERLNAATVGELLVISGLLPDQLHAALSRIREQRNKSMHDARQADAKVAIEATLTAAEMMKVVLGIDLLLHAQAAPMGYMDSFHR